METIKDWRGIERTLSNEIYVFIEDGPDSEYTKGTKVRLISGVDESSVVGYHFMYGCVTVCRITANIAEFVGVEKSKLKRLDEK